MCRAGVTLVEVLVSLAIGTMVVGMALSTGTSTRRFASVLDAAATAGQRRAAVPQLVGGALALAGRDGEACGLEVVDAGRRARVRGSEAGDDAPRTREVFAGLDGGGRPALYLRTLPHARQPWLEDVTDFEVLAARDEAGAWRTLAHDGVTRWSRLRVSLTWRDGDVRTYDLVLPHAPCAEALP